MPSLDLLLEREYFTGAFYEDQPIYRIVRRFGGLHLLSGVHPPGYNAGFGIDGVDFYTKTVVRKIPPVNGGAFGGGYHTVDAVFGRKKILYKDGIYFEGSDTDGIIETNASYEFLLEYTKKGRNRPILRVGSLRPERQRTDNP